MPSEVAEKLVSLLEPHAALGLSVREASRRARVPLRTTRAALADLERHGVVERSARGIYRLSSMRRKAPLATPEGERIWRLLVREDAPAYLTGLDVVAGSAQQFVFRFPHLVVTKPEHRDDLDWMLSSHGFYVRPLGSATMLPDAARVVLLATSAGWHQPVYQVRQHLAPPELAWVDLFRSARAGAYPITGLQLGQMLADLQRNPAFEHRIRVLARRHPRLQIAELLDGQSSSHDEFWMETAEGMNG